MSLLFLWLVTAAASHSSWAVTIDTVPVGNAGNPNDPLTGFGTVNYGYNIGRTEVTNAQYAEFLNLKAKNDPLGLYNSDMASAYGGITRSGVSGNFVYQVKPDMGNKPVSYVSSYDAIRFANWLNNGQGTADTETGAYTILGGTAAPSNGLSISRNSDAKWFLPSNNEWHKAAYHQPAAQGGDADDYWLYPTRSNSLPTLASAIDLPGPTRGDIANPGVNVINFFFGADWNGLDGNFTSVGTAGPLSESFYGTSDQGGNVFEWNEALLSGSFRFSRGGAFYSVTPDLQSTGGRTFDLPTDERGEIGFRVAAIPEPSSLVLSALGALGLLITARRKLLIAAP